MNRILIFLSACLIFSLVSAQEDLPKDYLKAEFHKNRRDAVRQQLPENSVAVFFANPVRNRSNDVDFVYHQDPNFYYLTGYQEPHAVLVLFSDHQVNPDGSSYNEILYVQERNPQYELWTGYRLGIEGAKSKLGFETVFNGSAFLESGIDFSSFESVLFFDFKDDYRDTNQQADLFDLIQSFKVQTGLISSAYSIENKKDNLEEEVDNTQNIQVQTDTNTLVKIMASLRQTKLPEELVLLKKAIDISVMGQIEVMKAMQPNMSEREIQGIHEFVYKAYGSEYEGYPSIVGGGHNGCVLHYIENNKTKLGNDLVLMDLGAEYHGYTADVTRTIPANGKFSEEQKTLYNIVLKAQEAGIKASKVGNAFRAPDRAARRIVYDELIKLGIADNDKEARQYFPHGTSHHLGLDVHDPSLRGDLEANMVITVEPGIYIPEGSKCDPKWYGIAIRIEDDILITENGPVNLSEAAPRTVKDIEKMMKEDSAFNTLKLPKLD